MPSFNTVLRNCKAIYLRSTWSNMMMIMCNDLMCTEKLTGSQCSLANSVNFRVLRFRVVRACACAYLMCVVCDVCVVMDLVARFK